MNRFIVVFLLLPALFFAQSVKEDIRWEIVSKENKFPEGPAWNNLLQELYVSNCYGDWITRIKEDKADTLITADSLNYIKTNGMVVASDGIIYACDYGLGAIIKIENGKPSVFIEGFEGKAFNRPNDITLDKDGNIYFSDPKSYGVDKLDGRLFYYNFENKELKMVCDSLAFPNGLAISPANGRLYLSESAKSRIVSFKVNTDGSLSDKKVFVNLPGGDPDGIDFDNKGNMYVAHFGGGKIYIISSNGEIIKQIPAPGRKPSNIEFGGKNKSILFITEDETNAVYKVSLSEIWKDD